MKRIGKRKDQSKVRPRVHEKIQNYFENMIDGAISPILRLKINSQTCNMKMRTLLRRALYDKRFSQKDR